VYPGPDMYAEGHCLYTGGLKYEVPESYAHGGEDGKAYFYLVYALDTDGQLWVSVNDEYHDEDEYSWDAVKNGKMTLRKARDEEGAGNVKDFIERNHQR